MNLVYLCILLNYYKTHDKLKKKYRFEIIEYKLKLIESLGFVTKPPILKLVAKTGLANKPLKNFIFFHI